jgi:predicted transcriptional regulator
LVGVYSNPAEAETRLREVDRADLIAWLDEAQRKTRHWKRRYETLFAEVNELRERQKETAEESEQSSRLRSLIHRLPDELVNGPDPLGEILENNRNREKFDGGEPGWFW